MINGGNRRRSYDSATTPHAGRERRAVAAWIGLFLLFFNVMAGGALAGQSTSIDPAAEDHLIICTAGGMAVIDRNGTPVTPDHAGLNGFCGYCLPMMHGAVIGTASTPLPLPFAEPIPVELSSPLTQPAIQAQLRLAQARAPPRS